ncbi:MAG: hypothetical protein IJP86_12150 [Synergistaceae bacterium]|nr:hypothetical protein [Synergistaceae bacterium]
MARKNPVSLALCCYYTITQGDAVMCIVDFAAKQFMTGGDSMKKYAVMVLAVMLVGVMAAGAWAVSSVWENEVSAPDDVKISQDIDTEATYIYDADGGGGRKTVMSIVHLSLTMAVTHVSPFSALFLRL